MLTAAITAPRITFETVAMCFLPCGWAEMLFAYFKRILSLDDFGYEVLAAPKMYLRRNAKLVAN
jgi:hypothetical protein